MTNWKAKLVNQFNLLIAHPKTETTTLLNSDISLPTAKSKLELRRSKTNKKKLQKKLTEASFSMSRANPKRMLFPFVTPTLDEMQLP